MGPKATGSAPSVRVAIEVTTAPAEQETPSEWVVMEEAPPPLPVLEPAVRDRLAQRLSSRTAKTGAAQRIQSAWQAGVDSSLRDLQTEDLVRPASIGLQNSCWLGLRVNGSAWCVNRKRAADKILKKEPATRLVAFPSQAEAEAFCLGFGLPDLPSVQ